MTSLFGGGAAVSVNASGTLVPETFIPANGQVLFNLTAFNYTPNTNSLLVFINGQKQIFGVDFLESSSSTFTLTSPVTSSDSVEVIGFPLADISQVANYSDPGGSARVGFMPIGVGALATTLEEMVRVAVNVFWFMTAQQIADVKARTKLIDVTAALQAGINYVKSFGGKLAVPQAAYKVSDSLNLGNSIAGYSNVVIEGLGLPQIISTNLSAPVFTVGGERHKLTGFFIGYSTLPAYTDVNAVGVRHYNTYECIFERLYFYNVFGSMDQHQGPVAGGQNAFFSNTVKDLRCVNFSGWGLRLIPYLGGNSGNIFSNIYINNRGGQNPVDNIACLGGVWIETSDDGVIDQLNIEWCKNSAPLLVLNQAGNITFNGLHLEGNYPQTSYNPLIDITGGGGASPSFNSLTVTNNNYSAAVGQALFRLDAAGSKVRVGTIKANNSTGVANMSAVSYGGSTCYGSTLEVSCVTDTDGSLQVDNYSPKISLGSVTEGLEYPVQRWNLNVCKQYSSVQDSVGGTASATFTLTGTALDDKMGLWNTASKIFTIKQPGLYNCAVTIPAGSAPTIQVKKNFTTAGTLVVTPGQRTEIYQMYLSRGDTVQFVLASGSFTRSGVVISVALAA